MEEDLTIKEFTEEFCEVVKEMYGQHNYQEAIDIVNNTLKVVCLECGNEALKPYRDMRICYDCGSYIYINK